MMKKYVLMKWIFGALLFSISIVSIQSCSKSGSTTSFTVNTIAGNGTLGNANGKGSDARFNNPAGIAIDSRGNLYVADLSNNSIRKITPNGTVSTYAGGKGQGFVDGQDSLAKFFSPTGIAVDAAGNVYVADFGNHRIRKINTAGVVSTLAGSDSLGLVNGAGGNARFSTPAGIVLDATGNLYVADTYNHCIRKVTQNGVVTTVAGTGEDGYIDGNVASARFSHPDGVVLDASGNIYVTDKVNALIRKISTAGVVSTIAGARANGYVNGPGSLARFNLPSGITIDGAGNIFIADFNNHTIRKITQDMTVSSIAGNGVQGFIDAQDLTARFSRPYGIVADPSGNLYVTDQSNNSIRKISKQ